MRARPGQRVLVTGGTSAIGRAIVERLTADGARVVFTGRDAERGAALAKATETTFVRADVREPDAIEIAVRDADEALDGLDGLVLGTGVLHEARVSETTDAAWDAVIETNLIAPYRFARACMPLLRVGDGGAIVAIASGTALWTEMELAAYSISKRALLWMTQMLAVEGAPHGVRVNAVCPGDTASGMTSFVNGRGPRDHGEALLPPIGRHAAPREIAAAVAFFLSPEASFCAGTWLTVDGGMRAALRASKVAG
jgi:NAD(P)-dependent dehydrogenase (short-subunit alcohol dehydrogenase family)